LPTDATSQQEFSDADWRAVATGDQSKKVKFDLSNLTTATTRVITMPDADITLWGSVSPTFTGTLTGPSLRLPDTGDASLSSTDHPFQTGSTSGANLIIDTNEIMARNNGAVATMFLNAEGGNVTIGDATSLLTVTGGQIAFPATQVPSSDANTLDDYEEGTATLTTAYATPGTSSWAYGARTLYYTKVGNLAGISVSLVATPTIGTGSGAFNITGCPFTAAQDCSFALRLVDAQFTWPASRTMVTAVIVSGASTINLAGQGSSVGGTTFTAAHMTNADGHTVSLSGVMLI
jgi:hypothetical protein